MRQRWLRLAVLVLAAAGCQRATRYGAPRPVPVPATAPAGEAARAPLDPEIQWMDPGPNPPRDDVPIVFVTAEGSPEEWGTLKEFWNAPPLTNPGQAAAVLGLGPLAGSALTAGGPPSVRVKVPPGLDDPARAVPASNPMTLGKWKLGQRLFFDDGWLDPRPDVAGPGLSCATCHVPREGFADHQQAHRDGFNAPTLVNCVFNPWSFWDGRAGGLEEVVQQTLEDEREPAGPERFRHVWHGVIGRLRENTSISDQFRHVFGTPPTQDAVGRALATFLRTILAGNSVHDRALAAQARKRSPTLEAEHYEAALGTGDVPPELHRPGADRAAVAKELLRGYRLFANLDPARRGNCVACHAGRSFTDGGFYNIGTPVSPVPGQETGRFLRVPVGRKSRWLIDAYKTPTLRGLLRTGPYLHDGTAEDLHAAIRRHAQLGPLPGAARDVNDLKRDEVESLVLFLSALNGDRPAPFIQSPPPAP
jgi:cytochrome c peroxidase